MYHNEYLFGLSGIERENYNDYLLSIIYILSVLQVFISWYGLCMLRIDAFFNMVQINKY